MIMKEISNGGIIQYEPAFMPIRLANALYDYCIDNVPWRQEKGKFAPFPRLTYWYADPGLTYTYSGVTHGAGVWTPASQIVRKKVEKYAKTPFNSLLVNYYRDGKDSIGWHTDAEPELGENPVIASLTLGTPRRFLMKAIKGKETLEYTLAPGSLLIMAGSSQHHWLHSVPKEPEITTGRINFTFRNILKTEELV